MSSVSLDYVLVWDCNPEAKLNWTLTTQGRYTVRDTTRGSYVSTYSVTGRSPPSTRKRSVWSFIGPIWYSSWTPGMERHVKVHLEFGTVRNFDERVTLLLGYVVY